MAAAKCTGEIVPPKMSADCKVKCDAQMHASIACAPGPVIVRIAGAADQTVAQTFKAATEKKG